MFRGLPGTYRVTVRGSGHPGKRYGPNGPRGETYQPPGAGAPPIMAEPEEKERGEGRGKGGFGLPLLGRLLVLHKGGWRVSVSPTLVESNLTMADP